MKIDRELMMDVWCVCPTTALADADNYYTKQEIDDIVDDISGLTTEQVEDIVEDYTYSKTDIDNALADKVDATAITSSITEQVDEAVAASTSGKADTSAVTNAIDAAVSGKADTSAVTNAIDAATSGKADTSAVTNAIDAATSGKADTSAVTNAINAAVSGKQDTLVSGVNIKTINNESLLGNGNITIEGGGTAITVDSALSSTSENPVQNKVIYAVIGDIETLLAAI